MRRGVRGQPATGGRPVTSEQQRILRKKDAARAADPTQIAQASPGRCADVPRGGLLLPFKHRFEPQVTKVILVPNGEAGLLLFKHRFEPLQEFLTRLVHDAHLLVSADCDGAAISFAR